MRKVDWIVIVIVFFSAFANAFAGGDPPSHEIAVFELKEVIAAEKIVAGVLFNVRVIYESNIDPDKVEELIEQVIFSSYQNGSKVWEQQFPRPKSLQVSSKEITFNFFFHKNTKGSRLLGVQFVCKDGSLTNLAKSSSIELILARD